MRKTMPTVFAWSGDRPPYWKHIPKIRIHIPITLDPLLINNLRLKLGISKTWSVYREQKVWKDWQRKIWQWHSVLWSIIHGGHSSLPAEQLTCGVLGWLGNKGIIYVQYCAQIFNKVTKLTLTFEPWPKTNRIPRNLPSKKVVRQKLWSLYRTQRTGWKSKFTYPLYTLLSRF